MADFIPATYTNYVLLIACTENAYFQTIIQGHALKAYIMHANDLREGWQ